MTSHTINVVFPVVSLNSLAGKEGFAQDTEFGEQTKAINLYVNQINTAGGINGRKINPIIVNFDPTNETDMRALCKNWTEGSPAAFAVLDGVGAWTGDNQLCVTQEGQTPLIGQWTTVTNWTNQGSPYLWWTGPDQAAILQAVVNWGLSSDLLGGQPQGRRDRRRPGHGPGSPSSSTCCPTSQRAGITPVVEDHRLGPHRHGHHQHPGPAGRPAAAERRRRPRSSRSSRSTSSSGAAGRDRPASTSPGCCSATTSRASSRRSGCIPVPYEQGARRPGGGDHRDAGRHRRRPSPEPGRLRPRGAQLLDHLAQGLPAGPAGQPAPTTSRSRARSSGWCQAIRLFATAAKAAGPDLNRRTFVTAMSKITNFPGHLLPDAELRPEQALRADPVPGGPAAQQRRRRPSARCPRTTSPRAPAGSTCNRSHRCRVADRTARRGVSAGVGQSGSGRSGRRLVDRADGSLGPRPGRRERWPAGAGCGRGHSCDRRGRRRPAAVRPRLT